MADSRISEFSEKAGAAAAGAASSMFVQVVDKRIELQELAKGAGGLHNVTASVGASGLQLDLNDFIQRGGNSKGPTV